MVLASRRDLAATGSAKGAELVGYRPSMTGAVARRVADKFAEQVSVLDFGAVGNGTADDTAAIQAAIDAVRGAGGGKVHFPRTAAMDAGGYYRLTAALRVWPGVSLVGDPRKPVIKNLTNSTTVGLANVFMVGNLHPDFTEDVTRYPCGTVPVGRAVTLTSSGDAANFAVGNQVFTYSTATSLSNGFEIPEYMHLNVVEAIVGATLTLRYPIDVAYAGGIGRLAQVSTGAGRYFNDPLFFSENSTIENLEIHSQRSWIIDSGARNVVFRNLDVWSERGPYGNSYQYCRWENCHFYYTNSPMELSLASIHCTVSNCVFTHMEKTVLGQAATANYGFGFQEYARGLRVLNATVVLSSIGTDYVFNFRQCRDVTVTAKVIHRGTQTVNGAFYFYPRTQSGAWANTGNVIDLDAEGTWQRYGQIATDGFSACDLRVRGNYRGTVATGQALWWNGGGVNVDVQGCTFEKGYFSVAASAVNNTIAGNYIENGISANGTQTDENVLRANAIRQNRTALSASREAVRRDSANAVAVATATTADVYTGALGTALSSRDDFAFVIVGQKLGTSADSTVRVYLRNVTDSVDVTLGTWTMLAAKSGIFTLRGNVMVANSLWWSWFGAFDGDAPAVRTGNATKPAATKVLELRVECANASGGTISFTKIKVSPENPYV